MLTKKLVGYCATEMGYRVQVIDNGEVTEEYTFGNCHGDSVSVVKPGSIGSVDEKTLWKWAKDEAYELADALDVPDENVFADEDLAASLREEGL